MFLLLQTDETAIAKIWEFPATDGFWDADFGNTCLFCDFALGVEVSQSSITKQVWPLLDSEQDPTM